ncbi:nucleotidyl transferase AbiEii/AbiGii toxin family protein [Campylobacter helveticus]|uniref:nucleotidyl transferase AbiEii/AbiGii toxin family protein n=1 Tax=Campylobacter helveticus TaxID=28898 RepID=UPI0022EA8BDF|nr:nucleotidyl transferase AbiEii/AbiGii toxin family protein [Campylobacter helveticus]
MLENYQKERIILIKEILPFFEDNFVLKGGTALSLFYGLDRYSEDLDFDCKNNNMNFINKLKKHKDFKFWKISIKKDTDLVFRAMLDYGTCSHLGAYPLKIEVSNRNKIFLQENKLKTTKKDGVNIYELDELIKMKVIAFSGRDKIRDFYDLGFLLKNYPDKFSDEALFSIYEKISYAGVEELNLLLLDEITNHKLVSNQELTINYTQDILEYIEKLQQRTTHSNKIRKR